MKENEYPILFKASMVRAILMGKKTQTRRLVAPKTSIVGVGKVDWSKFCWDGSQIYKDTCRHGHTDLMSAPLPWIDGLKYKEQYLHVPYAWEEDCTIYRIYPKWSAGDKLWVRENYCDVCNKGLTCYAGNMISHPCPICKWKPSIHMPRWASRITLEITKIRVERLQDITASDVKAEGTEVWFENHPERVGDEPHIDRNYFAVMWNEINAKRGCSWESNPWVWIIEFDKTVTKHYSLANPGLWV